MAIAKDWLLRNLYIRLKYFRFRETALLIPLAMRILPRRWTEKIFMDHQTISYSWLKLF